MYKLNEDINRNINWNIFNEKILGSFEPYKLARIVNYPRIAKSDNRTEQNTRI